MKSTDSNTTLINGYLRLLENLSANDKLELISGLTYSICSEVTDRKKSFYNAFGAWDSEQTADEIIAQLRTSSTNCP